AGNRRFYGGPLPWRPARPEESTRKIEGQTYKALRPGQQFQSFVCTDPEDHLGKFLAGYHGQLLYRIQIRRGLVSVDDKEVSATAVVGVEFAERQIQRPAG